MTLQSGKLAKEMFCLPVNALRCFFERETASVPSLIRGFVMPAKTRRI
jgi:hypothetical protein